MLQAVYPRLDLARVTFHLGMPHLLSLGRYQAITLPSTFGLRRVGIYVRRRSFQARSVSGLGILVHEAFHALQIQDSAGGWGLGLVRPFPVLYLACAAANRFLYDGHPIETDAYEHAGQRASRFDRALRDCAVAGEVPALVVEKTVVEQAAAGLAIHASGLAFWAKAWASAGLGAIGRLFSWGRRAGQRPALRPWIVLGGLLWLPLAALGALWLVLWLALWTAATAILWGVKILVEALLAAIAGVLYGAGTVLRGLGSRSTADG